ncbi:hypothetical protein KPL71_023061 [Citrus sinensis]|uniref:Uncharacterized protein n=1 Tax=Citrus sinensis TaxID=2711 RepID=A0ACB8IGM8_CITSI|nr:hypothetical protein KPL71_023061 [Citrus sinensis]
MSLQYNVMWSVGVRDNAIARAIVTNPKILVSDEATSALDAESKPVVQDVLESVIKNQAIIVVAHCFAITVEKGNHEILIDIPYEFYAYLVALHSSASTC